MQRTVRIDLEPTTEQCALLLETMRQQTVCFNHVAAFGWAAKQKNGLVLHRATYASLRARFPALPAQLVCSSRVRATEAIRSALANQRAGRNKVSCPQARLLPIRYDARSYRPNVKHGSFSLASVGGRLEVAFRSNPHAERWLSRASAFDSADLKHVDGRFRLHLVVTVDPPQRVESDQVVGVDLGLAHPAVTSNNRFHGARRWKGIERRYFRLRRSLQAKGTPSARRHLQRLRRRVERFRRDCDHVLSRRIVESVEAGATIVIEDLKEIRERTRQRGRASRRRMHGWSFARLRSFLEYKGEERGCAVVGVDPRQTSQRCSRCGHTERANRRSQALFRCLGCGYELNADLNAARNIEWKYRAGPGRAGAGGLSVNQPIVGNEPQPSFTCKPSASADGS